VGVAYEVARGLLESHERTNAVFLFNGGEETLMQVRCCGCVTGCMYDSTECMYVCMTQLNV
jgi:hypothetical protein